MTFLHFDTTRLRSYSAATKGGKSVIKIELETSDHYELADVLRQLDRIDAEQKAEAKQKRTPAKKPAPLALPAPPLALPYFPED